MIRIAIPTRNFGFLRDDSKWVESKTRGKKCIALAGSRTRVNCLEGSYANRYTTNALMIDSFYLRDNTENFLS